MDYVFDTSAIVVLVETCGIASQLKQLGNSVALLTTQTVINEYSAGTRSTRNIGIVSNIFSKVAVNSDPKLLPYFSYDASSGEFSVLTYVLQDPTCRCCVIDEEFGRTVAKTFELTLKGTVGIILMMKQMGLITRKEVRSIKRSIRASSFYLSESLLRELK